MTNLLIAIIGILVGISTLTVIFFAVESILHTFLNINVTVMYKGLTSTSMYATLAYNMEVMA